MEWYFALVLLLGTVCTAMFLGLPVAFAFFAANILGTFLFISGDIGLVLMMESLIVTLVATVVCARSSSELARSVAGQVAADVDTLH